MSNERCGSGYFFFNRTPTAEALRSFAEHVLVKADPVRSDLALNFRNVELPGAGQVAQFPFELVFSFGVPIRLDRGARLCPKIRVVIGTAKSQRHKVINLEVGVRTGWKAVLAEYRVIARA